MRDDLVKQAMRDHLREPSTVLRGGDGSARFVVEHRRRHGNPEAVPDPWERRAAFARLWDAVAAYRSGATDG